MRPSEWQPIETAPKDQVILLAYRADDGDGNEVPCVEAAIWSEGAFRVATPIGIAPGRVVWTGCSTVYAFIDAWMPLPAPPPKGDTDNG